MKDFTGRTSARVIVSLDAFESETRLRMPCVLRSDGCLFKRVWEHFLHVRIKRTGYTLFGAFSMAGRVHPSLMPIRPQVPRENVGELLYGRYVHMSRPYTSIIGHTCVPLWLT